MRHLKRMGISEEAFAVVNKAEASLLNFFYDTEKLSEENQYKVIEAFWEKNISPRHFAPSTGYGYADEGRQALSDVFARVVRAQSAVLSPHIASGTHAIALALYAVLRPLDTLISVTGKPYDTLGSVIGYDQPADCGSLSDLSVSYRQVDLLPNGCMDLPRVFETIAESERPKALFIQRSRGYEWRGAISMTRLREFALAVKSRYPDIIIIVDNCYGEFCETEEPTECGADIIAGSMIKNPGGGIAPTGGYIAGREDLIRLAENRLTCPGLGAQVGSYEASYRGFFQGLFMSPHVVGESLKGSILYSKVFEDFGFRVYPSHDAPRGDITQSIMLNDEKLLLAYTKAIQKAAAVDSRATPIPWDMPGYKDKVVMAAGTFVQGASIELSADAPVKPPYTVYAQGGLTYAHMKLGLMIALDEMGLVK
ncbi:MAG: methionine gamma-lyase family protein [Christensenellales bacterium]